MTFTDIFKKKYASNVWCNNCSSHSEVQIPKGVTINQFVESGKCPACGCMSLVVDYKQIDEFKRKLNQPNQKRGVPFIQPKIAPMPEARPSTKPVGYDESVYERKPGNYDESEYIDFTKPQPQLQRRRPQPQPQDFSLNPKEPEELKVYEKFDYWSGKPERQVRREEQKRGRR